MSFIHDIYEFKKSFRYIEKLTLRRVHLKSGLEYVYIYNMHLRAAYLNLTLESYKNVDTFTHKA